MVQRECGIAVQNPRHTYFDKVLMRSKHNEIVQLLDIVMPLCLLIAICLYYHTGHITLNIT